jgi:hypothetical protein
MKKILLLFTVILLAGFTVSAQIVAPFTQTFPTGGLPAGFTSSATSGSLWNIATNQTNNGGCPNSGDHTSGGGTGWAQMDQSGGDVGNVLQFDVDVATLTVPQLDFWYFMCGSGYTPANQTYVEYWNGTAWVTILSLTTGTTGWEEHNLILTGYAYTGTIIRLRFRAETGGSTLDFYGDNSIDDVAVIEAPTCIVPSNLSSSMITPTSASLSWTDNNVVAPAGGWEIEFGPSGFAPTGVANATAPTNPFVLTGLPSNTALDYYVRAVCGAGDSSVWSAAPHTFTTLATCPWPTNLFATNVTSNSATINWTENGTATMWGIEIGITGFAPTGTPTFIAGTNPFNIPGLPTNFTFDVYVSAICSATDTSVQTGPLTFTVCTPLAGTYTIDSAGSGPTNFLSFNAAHDFMQQCGISAPVTFNVMNANNDEQVILLPVSGQSATNTITFNGMGNTISSVTTSADRHVVRLFGASYYNFENLTIEALSTTNAMAMHLTGGGSNNTWTNCTFKIPTTATSSLTSAFAMSGSNTSATTQMAAAADSNIIDSCTFIGGYWNTMSSQTGGHTGNKVMNSTFEDFYAYGLYLYNQSDMHVYRNDFSRPTRTNMTTFYGVYLLSNNNASNNNLIEKNHMHDPTANAPTSTSAAYGVYVTADASSAANSNIVENNLIESMDNLGTQYAIYTSTANNLKVHHNTVSLDGTGGTGLRRGIVQFGTSAVGQDFKNNNISITSTSSGAQVGLYYQSPTINSDYNNVHGSQPGFIYGYNGNTNRIDLAAWQASTPTVGANSLQEDPLFLLTTPTDYRPANSNMNDAGTPLVPAVTTDFADSTRIAATPDMGAFEFAVSCPNPSNITAANVTGTTLDLSWVENGTATAWDIEVIQTGMTPTGVATYPGVTTNTNYAVTGLTQYQSTDFYVRAICGPGDSSVWFGPLTVVPCGPLAGNYTIDSTLPSGGTNFHSFTEVAVALDCGISAPVVFSVDNAVNNEQVVFDAVVGASNVNTITFNGNGNEITFPATVSAERHTIRLDGADHFRFNNLEVRATGTTWGFAMHLFNSIDGTNDNQFTNCTFEANQTNTSFGANVPFAMSGSLTSGTGSSQVEADSNIIDSCSFVGGWASITMYGQTNGSHNGNQVKNSTLEDFYQYGFYQLYQNEMLVSGNEISRPTRTSITSGYGLYASGLGSDNVYEKNRIHNMFGGNLTNTLTFYGFYFFIDASSAANSNIVRNNVVHNNQGNGTHYTFYASTANNLKVYHNTFMENDTASTSGTTRVIYQQGTSATGQDYQNNLVVLTRGGTGTRYGIYQQAGTGTFDYNNVWIDPTSTATNYYGFNSGNAVDLAAWQATTTPTVGANSSEVDPMFMNPAPDFSPSNSALNGTGNALGVLEDYTCGTRSTTNPDMGAFEFVTANTDMSVLSLLPDTTIGCYTNAEVVTVEATNAGADTINFVTNPMIVTVNVTGTITATLVDTVNTGTLPPFGILNVAMTNTIDLTANGAYALDATISTVGDIVLTNDTLGTYNYNVNLVAGTIAASPNSLCVSGDVTLSLTGNAGGSIQWQESATGMAPWTNIGTGTNPETFTAVTATTYYRAVVECNGATDSTTADTVVVSNPMIASTMGDTICGPNSAMLTASTVSPTGSIAWYDMMTGGTVVGLGDTLMTPVLSATDTFYAEANDGGLGGLSHLTTTAAGNGSSGNMFAVENTGSSPLTIDSFSILNTAPTTTTWTVSFANSSLHATAGSNTNAAFWTVVGTTTGVVNQGTTPTVIPIPVNITIPVGATYSFQIAGASVQYTNGTSTGAVFNSNADLTFYQGYGGSLNSMTFNPRVFNGEIYYSTGCPSTMRTAVVAVVNPSANLAQATSSNASSTTGTDTANAMQADGSTVGYNNAACELIATVTDAAGGNALGMVTSEVTVDATVQTHNTQPYTRRWFEITPTNNGPADVTIYQTQDDFDDYNVYATANGWPLLPANSTDAAGIANLRVTQVSGGTLGTGTPTLHTPATTWDAVNMRWELTFPVVGFSEFYVHTLNPVNAALAVSLTDFGVTKEGSVSLASWITETEQNNSHFNVQRSLDGNEFTTLGTVNTKAIDGNSNGTLNYDFTDARPAIGHNYYRLQMVDQAGKQTYSQIVDVVWGADGSVVTIYPNPATDKLNVDVSIDKVAQIEVRLLDMSGRVIKSVVQQSAKGMNNVSINLGDIATGVYGVQILENNNLIHTSKVNKTDK